MTHQTFAAGQVNEIGFETDQAARRNDRLDRNARLVMTHADDFAFAVGNRLQNVAEIFIRKIDIQIFQRLEQAAVLGAMENDFGPRHHHFVAFASHLFDQDRDLHFTARIELKCAGRFGIAHLQRNIAARLAGQTVTNVARGDKFSFASGKRRIVHQNAHPNCRRIDIDKLQRWSILRVGQGLADVNFFEAGQANNIASGSLFDLDLLEPFVSEKRSHVPAFAAAVAVKADDRVPYGDAPAYDPPERDPPEIIAVIKIRNEH